MALIKTLRGKTPEFGNNIYLAENATIIGDVITGNDCSIWFNAVIRGDVNSIRLGNKVNIQDGAVVHCTYQKHPTIIGDNVSIGHNTLVHGCEIKSNVLVGMGAIVMDNVVIESNVIIAAGAVVLQGTHIESGAVWAGVPAKKVKNLSEELLKGEIERIANNYLFYSDWYKEE
jgi:carbonic anhydrase/acetyltransferase-like protein (isoleucine patch superfamily)